MGRALKDPFNRNCAVVEKLEERAETCGVVKIQFSKKKITDLRLPFAKDTIKRVSIASIMTTICSVLWM